MAEGDVVHRTARRLDAALRDVPLTAVGSPDPRARVDVARLEGRTLERVEARGKHLLLRFGRDAVVHSHLGMSGAWHVYPRGVRWRRPRRSAWLVLSTSSADAVQFGGPRLALVDEARVRRDPVLRALGLDVLAPDFTPQLGERALRGGEASRELGDALLDQRLIAGVGNVYKSEACFAAGISPWRRLGEIGADELSRVCADARALMRDGLEGRRRARRVYRRARQPCLRCGSTIRSSGQGDAARTTYWCRGCQK
ncbi:MAG TPA: DNA-formamidopyrimidine glycosylase family protein [Solirubrobacterales bacterium]|nr:DNA-formamidopyrimidine glycosylase family protein [Solirubrobacterales bacterium]